MGVSNYFEKLSQLVPNFSKCLVGKRISHALKSVDHLYIDLNNILHACAKEPDDHVLHKICEHISALLRQVRVNKTLFIAIDGPAPRAKFLLQRFVATQAIVEA